MTDTGALIKRHLARLRFPSWFTPAIAADWVVSFLLLVLNKQVLQAARPFQQPLDAFIGDPTLQYKHVIHEHVPGYMNTWLTFMMPTAIVLLISIARRSLKEAHHAALAIWAGNQLNDVATNFIKMLVGRLRPDFFDRCQYDAVNKVCTGVEAVIQEGRRSFPSGHSSSSFYGCVFLVLFLAGKNRCFAYDAVFPSSGILQSRFLRICITLSPLFLCAFVAISRWEDHWHHPTDILAGSALGTLIALTTYHIWWPSPFVSSNFESMAYPRKTHVELEEQIREHERQGVDDQEPLLGV